MVDFEDLKEQIYNSKQSNLWKGIANEVIDNIEDKIDEEINNEEDFKDLNYDDIAFTTNNILYDDDFADYLDMKISKQINIDLL